MHTTRLARSICLLVLLLLTSFLAFFNLGLYLQGTAKYALPFDEGIYLSLAANMARFGSYGLPTAAGDFEFFPPEVSTGPAVLLPVAASFQLFGTGLVQGRLVTGVYLLLAVLMLFLVTDRLYNWKVAGLAGALFLTGAMDNPFSKDFPFEPVTHARYVLGEVPGFFFFLLGVWLWGQALSSLRPRSWLLVLAGLSWGMAVQSKPMYALIAIAFLVWSVLDWRGWRTLLFPLAGTLVPGILWLSYQVLTVGPGILLQRNILGWPNYSPETAGLVFTPSVILGRIGGLAHSGFVIFGLPAIVVAVISAISARQGPKRSVEGFLLTFGVLWTGWYIFSTLGRARHALPGFFVLSIFLARLLYDLGDGLVLPKWSQILKNWRSREFWAGQWRTAAVALLLVLLLLNPTKSLFRQVILDVEDSPQQVVAYLRQQGAQPARIAASERELDFLLGAPLHDLIWHGDQLPSELDYIICGSQAKQYITCPPTPWAERSRLVLSVGEYDVYHIAQEGQ